MKLKKYILFVAVALVPSITFAQASTKFNNFESFVNWIITAFINPTIAVIFALVIAYFMWGAMRFIFSKGSQDERQKGISVMTNGIFAIFIMVTFWGFVYMITASLGF